MNAYHGDKETFVHDGHRFEMRIEHDEGMGAPWEEHDGHGPVRCVFSPYASPNKRPGERLLHRDSADYWLYDWQAACRLARRDGWNAHPFDAPNRVERAVQADFDRLRGWLRGDWYRIGVCVREVADDHRARDDSSWYEHALWGIESDSPDYHKEVAHELAEDILYPRRKAWRLALAQAREQRNAERLAAVMAAPIGGLWHG